MATPDISFLALDSMHDELEEFFLLHQERLIAFDLKQALASLERFTERLCLHMRQEERLLLPIRANHSFPAEGNRARPVEIYIYEHRKLEQLLGKIHVHLRLLTLPVSPPPRLIISLLEREAVFKHVLEHHNERERKILYVELDGITSAEERRRVVAVCLEEWSGHKTGPSSRASPRRRQPQRGSPAELAALR